ncbi:hypothetical protein BBBOND_0303800 [Babesia bigemina]|uniref:Uncharacterized protein n=1 Tax=Babesia bigemina TaxID=5866 RepID=A0A061D6Z2_BABBI|nr:hypothetical protein BBBOND_0303800 [Babesia bigemina]CDR96476.1 hypothetical protein BBBOND_0303800 [Babesia bigemina]|eukprot:XP_012768662.1 hypothetical protein BBBOND_0303800 [Babesia bigemina]
MAQHFKKLTDCPENLREAIDWLIQVRHGGDGKGLEKLAKALTILIGEAISNATKSFDDRQKQLECADKSSDQHSHHCTSLDKQIKDAKEKSDDSKALKIESDKKKHIDADHSLTEDARKKALNGITDHRNQLNELQNKLEPFFNKLNKTTRNDRDSILHNLCSGLETFLGFNAATKGYTGKGIVYADLDRLCDAVMAFLYGVLERCHKLLKHYNRDIDDNIRKLKNEIDKGVGVKSFGEAIENVKAGLNGYENEFGTRTQNVINGVSTYLSLLGGHKAYFDTIPDRTLVKINKYVGIYIREGNKLMGKLIGDGDTIRVIDAELKIKLYHSIDVISHSIKNLEKVSQDDTLLRAVNALQGTLDSLPGQVENFINTNIGTTVKGYEVKVEEFKKSVKDEIEKSRDTFLTERLKQAQIDLHNAVRCANKNASNLGGLRNETVKMAVEAIQTRLKSADEDVNDEASLKALKSDTVDNQITNITGKLNEEKCSLEVKNTIKSLQVYIGEPDVMFNEAHQIELGKLVIQAQTNLKEALKCAQENAKNMGGLKNVKVAGVIGNIQKKFIEVDNIKKMRDLQELESEFMKGEIQKITEVLNYENAAGVTTKINSLPKNMATPKKIFDTTHEQILTSLANKAQKELLETVKNTSECIQTHGVLHKEKIKKALEGIEEALRDIETPGVDIERLYQVVTGVEEQLSQLESKVDSTLQATVKPAIQKLNADFTPVKATVNKREPTNNAELIFLITATKMYAIDALHLAENYSVDSTGNSKEEIVEIVNVILKNLKSLDGAFSKIDIGQFHITINPKFEPLKKNNVSYSGISKAHLDNLGIDDLTTKIQQAEKSLIRDMVESAKPKINFYFTNSKSLAGQIDKSDTTELKSTLVELEKKLENHTQIKDVNEFYTLVNKVCAEFEKLRTPHGSSSDPTFKSLLSVILEIEKPAWKALIKTESNIFQTTINFARAAVSAAVEKAKKDIKAAEDEYQIEIGRIRSRIEGEVESIQKKAGMDQLGQVTSGISPLFATITETITNRSVYSEDLRERMNYFGALKDLIEHTIKTLETAYQKAYQSAAKSYLSGAIDMINTTVEGAEKTYEGAVNSHIQAIREKVPQLAHEKFTRIEEREKLKTLFDADFDTLQKQIKVNSAFSDDFNARKTIFDNLQILIKHTVENLNAAYQKAYQSSAQKYLAKAIKDIRSKIADSERMYVDGVMAEVQAVERLISGLEVKMFKVAGQRKGLGDRFNAPLEILQTAVASKSVFKEDLDARTNCFQNLKSLLSNTVKTLVDAANTFDNCAERVEHYLTESLKDASRRINALGSNIKKEVKNAFDEIVSHVYDMYSKDKIAQLDAVQECITEQLDKIKSIIEKDKKTSIKGLLKTVSGLNTNSKELYNRLEQLKDKPSIELLAPAVKSYLDLILIYAWNDMGTLLYTDTLQKRSYQFKGEKIKDNFNELLNHLATTDKIYNYDHTFVNLLEKLKDVLNDLSPQEFGAMAYPVFDALRKGLNGFTEQLGYVYINKYVGSKPIEWHVDKQQTKLSQDATRCAKIFLTLIPEWHKHIPYLNRECNKGCTDKNISLQEQKMNSGITKIVTNPLGLWFDCRGYKVSGFDKQEGELRNNSGCTGKKIGENLRTFFDKRNTFGNLLYYLYEYYKVCHVKYIPSPKPPTTICQMLHWLCGLEYTPMYENVKSYLQEWFNDFKKEHEIEKALPATVPKRTGHEVVTDFNLGNLLGSYQNVTIRASEVLLAILGYGDADGRYACEFYTNPYNLYYPTDKAKCFDMLVDICLRLNHQLRFLYMQCHNGTRSGGWADCRYGKNIAGSAWNCNRLQCVEQGCDQNCKWHNDCGVKSPLQSFLEDGLKGFLPHQFTSPSCKLECSVKNHNGIPCKTPMGFADISITASWTRTGHDIKKVLDPYCGTLPDSLSLLCAYFLCLLRRPPQTLCDMFAFYENFFEHWSGHYDSMRKEHVKKHKHDAFFAAVASANFGVEFDGLDPTTMFGSSSHSSAATTHLKGDLFAIVNCKPNENPVHPCGSYLQPLSYEVRCVFTEKLAADYLSWIVYITETFYNLLNDLYNKCTKCCIQQQADCYGRICAKGCTVDSTTEAAESKKLTDKTHGELCNSIVQCAGIHPTIYAAGFTFGSPWSLSGDNGVGKKRSCKDFCTALGMVVAKYNALYNLVNKHIPDFLWEIRYKFFYTLVALWAYSLLYLLYVIIGRLDTFHIRSHLRLQSSHKISAQSLLATARLNNLAKLAYLRT